MTISKYIEINPLVYLFAILSILTASFIPFIIITTLIIFHELGHFLIAVLFKVEVDKIYLYPLGGISKFHLPLNYSFIKEFIILISGPIFQEITKAVLLLIIPQYTAYINMYHYGILIFNMLPIYPLDGGKLVQLILSAIVPYKASLNITIKISYLIILTYFLLNIPNIKISVIIITFFLIYKVKEEEKKIKYLYEKFILERYLNNYNFRHSKLIYSPDNFYKNKRHLINENNNYYLEKEYLQKKYEFFKKSVDNKKSLC